jgi:hypothetical protein
MMIVQRRTLGRSESRDREREKQKETLMLAAIVLVAQVATAMPPNPCADQLSALCRISPLFCPTAYPTSLVPGTNAVPCWPERPGVPVARTGRTGSATRNVGFRGDGSSAVPRRASAPAPSVTDHPFFSALSKLVRLRID